MNKAAQVAGGVFDELIGAKNPYYSSIYHFGVMIGQHLGSGDYHTPKRMEEAIQLYRDRFPGISPQIEKALTMLEGGMNHIEAIERCTGYYDEKTGRPWREIYAEEEKDGTR